MSATAGAHGRRGPLVHDIAALERTALAWERTAVSLAAVGALLLKVVEGGRLIQAGGVLLVGVAVVIVIVLVPLGYRRARARVDPDRPDAAFTSPDRWRRTVLVSTAAAVSATVVAVAADIWMTGAA